MFKVAILDDYQHAALSLANWNSLRPDAEVEAFSDNLVDLPRLAERLHGFHAVVLMRERTHFLALSSNARRPQTCREHDPIPAVAMSIETKKKIGRDHGC